MPTPILQLNNVGFSFDGGHNEVLADISFACDRGDALSVMGASGVGKTTLCRLIAGLIKPTKGAILFRGKPVGGPSPAITISFQDYPCFPWLSVEDNLLFGVRGLSPARREAATEYAIWLLDQVGLGHARKLSPRKLSGGMLQRLSVARALAVRPEVLILDEPFSALDPRTKADLKALLHRLREKLQFTLLVVLHSLDDAHGTGERAIVLGGKPAGLRLDAPVGDLEYVEFERQVLATLSGTDLPSELLDAQSLLNSVRQREPLSSDVLTRYVTRPLDDWLRRRLHSEDSAYVANLLESPRVEEQRFALSLASHFQDNAVIRDALLNCWSKEGEVESRVRVAAVLADRDDLAADVRRDAIRYVCANWDAFVSTSVNEENHSPAVLFQSEVQCAISDPMSRLRRSFAVMRLVSRATSLARREILATALQQDTLDIDADVRKFCNSHVVDAEAGERCASVETLRSA